MSFQTFDIPGDVLDQATTAAKTANMDIDAYVTLALRAMVDATRSGGTNSSRAVTLPSLGSGGVSGGGRATSLTLEQITQLIADGKEMRDAILRRPTCENSH